MDLENVLYEVEGALALITIGPRMGIVMRPVLKWLSQYDDQSTP